MVFGTKMIACPCECGEHIVAKLRPSVAFDGEWIWWVRTCRAQEASTFVLSRGYKKEEFQKLWDSQKHLWLEA